MISMMNYCALHVCCLCNIKRKSITPFFGNASNAVKNTLSLILLLITALRKLGAHLNRKYPLHGIFKSDLIKYISLVLDGINPKIKSNKFFLILSLYSQCFCVFHDCLNQAKT